jgi:predicted ArsR family transcriptional regulator
MGSLVAELRRLAADPRWHYRERVVFGLLSQPYVGQRALARMTGIDRRSVRFHLEELIASGKVEVDGRGRYGSKRYRIVAGPSGRGNENH